LNDSRFAFTPSVKREDKAIHEVSLTAAPMPTRISGVANLEGLLILLLKVDCPTDINPRKLSHGVECQYG
jgi:hypothetical protein